MVPQLPAVDTLGNKEPNANWSKEPNSRLPQVCANPALTSPGLHQDAVSPSASPADPAPRPSDVSEKPGSDAEPELVAGGPRDSNANVETLRPAGEKEIREPGAASAVSASKVNERGRDCRVSAAKEERASVREDNDKHVIPKTGNLNQPREFRDALNQPPRDDKGNTPAPASKDGGVPRAGGEPDRALELPASSRTAPLESEGSEAGFTNKNTEPPETDLPPVQEPPVPSDKRQSVSSQMDASAPLPAKQNMAACGQVAADVGQLHASVSKGQQHHGKQYREASTMTFPPASTAWTSIS